MPYHVFRISPERKLTLVKMYARFQEEKQVCRELRSARALGDRDDIRMIFAEDEVKAKRLLTDKHKPASPLEEWEA
jgi:hypothetical protein